MSFKALVFDFDGIITDTEPIHMDAWQSALDPIGVEVDEEEFRTQYIGMNDRDFLDAVGKNHGHHFSDTDKASLIEQKSIATIGLLEREIPLISGVADFIESVRNDYLLSICSGANRSEIEFMLKHLKWTGYFNPIIASDSVKRGKPDPEGYIRAYEGLVEIGDSLILSEEVIAIEDSPKGITAAKKAGLKCIAVSNTFEPKELMDADWILGSLADIDLNELI